MKVQTHDKLERDIRLQTTIWIWGLSILLMCSCIPIVTITETGVTLPILILLSVAVGTISIWYFATPKLNSPELTKLKQMTERIENLEAIASHDQLDTSFQNSSK